ncbi:CHRD domain-containing protein [Actinophytocola sp.]|uniref:CHRD domain-containing protein n=1 Tax=Actinophytocola sp. TaxID=1872138 RepID=UPI002ED27F6C
MKRHRRLLVVAVTVGAAAAITASASASTPDEATRGQNSVREQLSGFAETPLAISTPANGEFRLRINNQTQEITWRLTYSDVGTGVTQAHVHFGSPAQTGGISFFLCTNLGNGPAGTQPCPAAPATVSGTIAPADIIGPVAQGIAAGEFTEIVDAIHAGLTYVNVHSTAFPVGEIRAQLGHHH